MSVIPEAILALTGLGLEHFNTLSPFEIRPIVLAQGKQFRNGDPAILLPMPASPAVSMTSYSPRPRSPCSGR